MQGVTHNGSFRWRGESYFFPSPSTRSRAVFLFLLPVRQRRREHLRIITIITHIQKTGLNGFFGLLFRLPPYQCATLRPARLRNDAAERRLRGFFWARRLTNTVRIPSKKGALFRSRCLIHTRFPSFSLCRAFPKGEPRGCRGGNVDLRARVSKSGAQFLYVFLTVV